MSRKFMTVIAATSIAIAGLAAQPSFAGSKDRDKALLGITALVLLGTAIADSANAGKPQGHAPVRPKGGHYHGQTHGYGHNQGHGNVRPVYIDPKPLPPRVRTKTLPRRCLVRVQTRHKNFAYMGGRCLQKNYRWSHALPRRCAIKIKGHRGVRQGYAAGCLKRHGYRFTG